MSKPDGFKRQVELREIQQVIDQMRDLRNSINRVKDEIQIRNDSLKVFEERYRLLENFLIDDCINGTK